MNHLYDIGYNPSSPLVPDSALALTNNVEESRDVLNTVFSCLDLTSLNTDDTAEKIRKICRSVNELKAKFPLVPNVAAICVFPLFVPVVHNNLHVDGVRVVSVAGGFPSAQTYHEIKLREVQMALDHGASEIDIVLPLGMYFSQQYESVIEEVRTVKNAMGSRILKVILETGLLKDPVHIWKASLMAMEGGADFIKTSTGKIQPAATIDAFQVMIQSVKMYFEKTGRKVGIKAAGGISTTGTALKYYHLVRAGLGSDWLTSDLFRIGASRLANALLKEIVPDRAGERGTADYF